MARRVAESLASNRSVSHLPLVKIAECDFLPEGCDASGFRPSAIACICLADSNANRSEAVALGI